MGDDVLMSAYQFQGKVASVAKVSGFRGHVGIPASAPPFSSVTGCRGDVVYAKRGC